jgi:hypothetical protein
MAYEATPEVQVSNRQLASDLYRQKHQARQEKSQSEPSRAVKTAGTTAQAGGRAIQVGGAATEYGGKAVKYGGKGVQTAGRGVESGGQAITRAGAGLSETGYGAIVGVPLAVVGAGITGLGAGMQAVGKGAEAGGEAAEKGGQVARKTGKQISSLGSRLRAMPDSGLSLRSGKHQDRQRRSGTSVLGLTAGATAGAMNISESAQERLAGAVHLAATPFRLGTDMALRSSWTSLIASWGLTLIYINIHVFFRFVIGTDFFCKLGDEWSSSPMALAGGGGMTEEAAVKVLKPAAGVIEALGLVLLDLLVLAIILLIFELFTFVVGMVTNPIDFIGQTLS